MDCKLEVITLPVRDPDAARAFYNDVPQGCSQQLDFHVDVDWALTPAFGVVQLTPPDRRPPYNSASASQMHRLGPARRNYLVVTDIGAAHHELNQRAVQTSDIFHKEDRQNLVGRYHPGTDPNPTGERALTAHSFGGRFLARATGKSTSLDRTCSKTRLFARRRPRSGR